MPLRNCSQARMQEGVLTLLRSEMPETEPVVRASAPEISRKVALARSLRYLFPS